MPRHVRTLATLALTATLTLLTGAGIAGAQEMEHGRTRPANRELQTNQVKTQDAVANSWVGYIRG